MEDWKKDLSHFDFKSPEDLQKCLDWVDSLMETCNREWGLKVNAVHRKVRRFYEQDPIVKLRDKDRLTEVGHHNYLGLSRMYDFVVDQLAELAWPRKSEKNSDSAHQKDTGAEAPSAGKYENWPVQKLEGDALDVAYGGREVPPLQAEVFRLRWKMNEVIGRVNHLYSLANEEPEPVLNCMVCGAKLTECKCPERQPDGTWKEQR
jgi:hypothetical protein